MNPQPWSHVTAQCMIIIFFYIGRSLKSCIDAQEIFLKVWPPNQIVVNLSQQGTPKNANHTVQ
jgi:hypothetical protein